MKRIKKLFCKICRKSYPATEKKCPHCVAAELHDLNGGWKPYIGGI